MKNTRMAMLNTRRKIKAIKRRSGKSKKPRLAITPTNIKNTIPVRNAFISFVPEKSDVLPDFY